MHSDGSYGLVVSYSYPTEFFLVLTSTRGSSNYVNFDPNAKDVKLIVNAKL